MIILDAGLQRTGTTSLTAAMRTLGYTVLQHAPERLDLWNLSLESLRCYDAVEFVSDLPAAYFWRELDLIYEPLVILTTRDPDRWYESVEWHNRVTIEHNRYWNPRVHQGDLDRNCLAYGSPRPNYFLWTKRFLEHQEAVRGTIPAQRLLVLDLWAGQGWPELCRFLDRPVPDVPFPHLGASEPA